MSSEKDFLDSNTAVWAKLEEFEGKLDANTAMTQQVVANTADLIEAFNALKGVVKSLEFLGKIARPVLWIAGVPTAVMAAWLAIKTFFKS